MQSVTFSEGIYAKTVEGPSLTDVLLNPLPRGFDSLAVVPSNVRAVEAGLLFANGLLTFGAVCGASGWGKSHLLAAVANRIGTERGSRFCELWSAPEWIGHSKTRNTSAALILDNVQDALARPRSRQLLRLALERRIKAGWPTLLAFTEPRWTRGMRSALPYLREWSLVQIRIPDEVEREVIVGQMASAEGVLISPELRRILAHRIAGNGRTLLGALKRLRLADSKWISPRDVLRACGVLNPFFAANSAWDLRDHVVDQAGRFEGHSDSPTSQELAIYAMLRIAQLSEADVARYLAVDPGRAYSVAQRVETALCNDERAQAIAESFVDQVVAALRPS